MDATHLADCWERGQDAGRPWMFLVSTPARVADLPRRLGAAEYSYGFVVKALLPALERIGPCRMVPNPESRLLFAAAKAAADGYRPVHLAVAPLHRAFLTPALPNILFPFWEFPRIPDRDFGTDTRQNWSRIARRATLILTACRLTAHAFETSGARCPVQVVPVPPPESAFEVPEWSSDWTFEINCRHVSWGGPPPAETEAPPAADAAIPTTAPPRSLKHQVRRTIKLSYLRHVKPWLSPQAQHWVTTTKRRALARWSGGRDPDVGGPGPDRLESHPLKLGGLVYTSIFNLSDLRKNPRDLLTAFVTTFRDRPEVTLVLKLAACPQTELVEINKLQAMLSGFGIPFRCRVVAITDYLSDAQLDDLMRVTTFYVNTSRAEGACLPLQQALASGRPAIAPANTAMADYMDEQVGFVVESHPEPTHWPHDPEERIETTWNRLVWSSLRAAFRSSAELVARQPSEYQRLAAAARSRMIGFAGLDVVTDTLRRALSDVDTTRLGALDWDERAA